MSYRSECVKEIASHITDSQLIRRLRELDHICSEIEGYQNEYDYKDVTCNGFRTFVSMVNLFVYQFAESCRDSVLDKKAISDYNVVSQLLHNNAQAATLIRNKGHDYPLQVTDQDCDIMLLLSQIEPKHMEPLYKKSVGPFYIRTGFMATFKQMVTVIGFFGTTNFFQRILYFLWPGYRSKFLAKVNTNPSLKAVLAMDNYDWFPANVLLKFLNKPSGCSMTRISIARNFSDWRIRLPNVKATAVIEHRPPAVAVKSKVPDISCLVLKPIPGEGKHPKSLLMHIPGGGFVISPAPPYVELMSRICRELGICVIIPEYYTAPAHPYPCAIQDLIDLYLFLMSKDERVLELIGFHPENIVLSGDSAGGQLAVVLTIALNEIRRKGGDVRMPHALSVQYPAAVVGFVAYPGVLLSGLDMVASMGQLRITTLVYAQTDPPIDQKDIEIDLAHEDKNRWREIMKRFNDRLKDPLYNPIVYDSYEDMANIPISIIACEMDCIMDHSIFIANKWKGKVTLDIGRGLPHGFTAVAKAKGIQQELSLLIQRLAALLPPETSKSGA